MSGISKNRLEAFSDGVLAIVITIMVLEMKVPHGTDIHALQPIVPIFLSYVLSFIYLGIYWNNHHHLLHAAGHVNARIMWANLHLLFWLSLVPFASGWLGENYVEAWPVALYGAVLLMAALDYLMLQTCIVSSKGRDSALGRAIGRDWKGKVSLGSYTAALALAFLNSWLSIALYVFVAVLWLIPDKRVEGLPDKST